MHKFFKVILVLVGLMFLSACLSYNQNIDEPVIIFFMADYPHYNSIEHLASHATEVVRVEVLDERIEMINSWSSPTNELEDTGGGTTETYDMFTVYRIKVLEVFQGDVSIGDILEVRQMGGQSDDLIVINLDRTPLVVGDDLVLFILSFDIEDLPSVLLNPRQSAYRFTPTNEDARVRNVNDTLESLYAENDLVLTLSDLALIVESNNN